MTHIEKLHLEAITSEVYIIEVVVAAGINLPEYGQDHIADTDKAAKKSAEITENIAIDFAEWIERKKLDSSGKHLHILRLLPKELFQEYLKSKENEQKKEG